MPLSCARDIGSDLTHAGQNDLTVTRPGQNKADCDMRHATPPMWESCKS